MAAVVRQVKRQYEARARMRAKGFEAEAEERRIRGYEPEDSDEATMKPS